MAPSGRRNNDGRPFTLGDLNDSANNNEHGDRSRRQLHSSAINNDENQDFFAGGEKSGLAVQNPNTGPNSHNPRLNLIHGILDRARRNVLRPGGDDPEVRPSYFSSTGQTLGGDDVSSVIVPAPESGANPNSRVLRRMHIWRDGFSVDDGPLYRYDDENNGAILEMINAGQAPLEVLNVKANQEINLEVEYHKNDDYRQSPAQKNSFSGEGRRLGTPSSDEVTAIETPGLQPILVHRPSSSSPTTSTQSAAAPLPLSSSSSSSPHSSSASVVTIPTVPPIDENALVSTFQIRLGDGTILRLRLNPTLLVDELYKFVDNAMASSETRSYVLMTTFPSTELSDRQKTIEEFPELKRGAVLVQRWL